MSAEQPETSHARKLLYWGAGISVGYILLILIYAWFMRRAMMNMTPDEFATFLSGVFAPLAFLWLVLGFRQQGDELQNSARALWLQGEELRNSVEQQRQLVDVSRQQFEANYEDRIKGEHQAEMEAQPLLTLTGTLNNFSGRRQQGRFAIQSAGPVCKNVSVTWNREEIARTGLLAQGEHLAFNIQYDDFNDVRPVDARVLYTDRRGNVRLQQFLLPVNPTGAPGGNPTLGDPVNRWGVIKEEQFDRDGAA